MSQVFVELMRQFESGSEGIAVFLNDSPELRVDDVIQLDGDDREWTVYSVHRCKERPDGTTDHSECWR